MNRNFLITMIAAIVVGAAFATCAAKKNNHAQATMIITSTFADGDCLPLDYTCEGKNISPQLTWGGIPTGAKSFSIICTDPDAPSGKWVHWVIFNIPGTETSLSEGIPAIPVLQSGACQGINDFKKIGYGGACPPKGHGPHRYVFKVYALDCILDLKSGVKKSDVEKAMKGHVLGMGQLAATYLRE